MTITEFVRESEMFRYSKEYCNLFKEASELAFMDLFLETQNYVHENEEITGETLFGFMTESVNVDNMFMARYNEKAESFMTAVISIAKTVWKALIQFFSKIVNVIVGTQQEQINKLAQEIRALNCGSSSIREFSIKNKGDLQKILDY